MGQTISYRLLFSMSMSEYVNWKSGKVRSFVSFTPSQRICPLRGSVTRPTTKRDVREAKSILLLGLCTLKFPAITYILYTCPNFPILQQFLYHSVGFTPLVESVDVYLRLIAEYNAGKNAKKGTEKPQWKLNCNGVFCHFLL